MRHDVTPMTILAARREFGDVRLADTIALRKGKLVWM